MRVILDISSFTSGKDTRACYSVGQRVSWSSFNGKCTSDDVLDDGRLSSLRATLTNMEDYLSRMLRVQSETSDIHVSSVRDIPLGTTHFTADLVIAVALRPFSPDSKLLGAAFPETVSPTTGRAIIGGMYLNPAYVPDIPQSVLSLERFFFTVIFHELVHVLGFSQNGWHRWIDRSTGGHYASPSTTFRNATYSKSFTIVHTPALHRFVSHRFGVDTFAPGVLAGMEIEDGGGSGTADAHPEARVYGGEVMCGVFVGYVWISGLSLAVLEDTGWYEVDYEFAEPYPWGDGRSLSGNPLAAFPVAAPQLAFPKHYLCWERDAPPICNYDFLSKAFCSPQETWKCPGNDADSRRACEWRQFVNPLGLPVRGSVEEFDYLYFKVGDADARCDDPAKIGGEGTGEEYGIGSMCVMSNLARGAAGRLMPRCHRVDCDENGTVWIAVGVEIQECVEDGEMLEFEGFRGAVECPERKLICGMKAFMSANIPFPTERAMPSLTPRVSPKATGGRTAKGDGQGIDWISVLNVALGVGIVVVLVGGLWALWRRRWREPARVVEPTQTERAEPRLDIRAAL